MWKSSKDKTPIINADVELEKLNQKRHGQNKYEQKNVSVGDIDSSAVDTIDDEENNLNVNHIEGERKGVDLDQETRRFLPSGARSFVIFITACAIIISGIFIKKALQVKNTNINETNKNNIVRNTLPPLNLAANEIAEDIDEITVIPQGEQILPIEEQVEEISPAKALQKRRLSSGLIAKNTESNNNTANEQVTSNTSNVSQDNFNGDEGELQNKLKPLRLNPSAAGVLRDRDYLLTQGTMMDCQLETKIVTTQPGMTTCYVTRNIYSASGRVVLIDRGSKIVGNYQGGITQGQARIFVLWSRIETPQGVIINVDSPGSGSLGEGGLGGYVDNHFWQRFGGAIMMSLIGDLGEYVSNQGKKNKKSNTIEFNNTTQGMQDAAVEALKNSINIPPTLYKNQGERISIFVARDLDFRGVYGLEPQ